GVGSPTNSRSRRGASFVATPMGSGRYLNNRARPLKSRGVDSGSHWWICASMMGMSVRSMRSVPSAVHPVGAIVTREPRLHPEYRRTHGRGGHTCRVVDDSDASDAAPESSEPSGRAGSDPRRHVALRGPAHAGRDSHAATLRPLVESGVLTEQQLDAVLRALAGPPARPPRTKLLAEIAAYTGAGLLLA